MTFLLLQNLYSIELTEAEEKDWPAKPVDAVTSIFNALDAKQLQTLNKVHISLSTFTRRLIYSIRQFLCKALRYAEKITFQFDGKFMNDAILDAFHLCSFKEITFEFYDCPNITHRAFYRLIKKATKPNINCRINFVRNNVILPELFLNLLNDFVYILLNEIVECNYNPIFTDDFLSDILVYYYIAHLPFDKCKSTFSIHDNIKILLWKKIPKPICESTYISILSEFLPVHDIPELIFNMCRTMIIDKDKVLLDAINISLNTKFSSTI